MDYPSGIFGRKPERFRFVHKTDFLRDSYSDDPLTGASVADFAARLALLLEHGDYVGNPKIEKITVESRIPEPRRGYVPKPGDAPAFRLSDVPDEIFGIPVGKRAASSDLGNGAYATVGVQFEADVLFAGAAQAAEFLELLFRKPERWLQSFLWTFPKKKPRYFGAVNSNFFVKMPGRERYEDAEFHSGGAFETTKARAEEEWTEGESIVYGMDALLPVLVPDVPTMEKLARLVGAQPNRFDPVGLYPNQISSAVKAMRDFDERSAREKLENPK